MTAARQYLSVPAKLHKEWQPRLYEWNPYHCSFPDVAKIGWQKWSAEHPDWLAPRASSHHIEWFNRKTNNIRRADYKAVSYQYEKPSKPTSRTHDNFVSISGEVMPKSTTVPMPPHRFYAGQCVLPRPQDGEVPAPRWGQYHPNHYEDPYKLQHLPPLKIGGYPYYPQRTHTYLNM